MVNESIICAGFGGQGIMVLGKVFATAAMEKDFHVTWFPAYGAEVRGGTAYSMVRVSEEPIANPIVEQATAAVIMNTPSLEKFEKNIKPGGLLILNTSLVKAKVKRKDIEVIPADLTEEAVRLGNIRVANMIAAGIYAAKTKIFDKKVLLKVISIMAAGREELVPINVKAVELGEGSGSFPTPHPEAQRAEGSL
ncbi:MAG: 2-oxoacid:acceptor oxidoreductase family protein [Candidatus Omnitrophica bacterium]|nr:2-oxoacid:acceptor oxidoreductase family protein [Candidatus Omnitrophota bacterium]